MKWQFHLPQATALILTAAVATTGLGFTPSGAWASPPPTDTITPDSAEVSRAAARIQARQADDDGARGEMLARRGRELQDPRLLADAAAAFVDHARVTRDLAVLDSAEAEAALAVDLLEFLRSGRAAPSWQPLETNRIDAELADVGTVLNAAQALRAEIEAEQAAANAPPPAEQRRKARPGTGLIAGGASALVIGAGGLGLGAAGLAMGQSAQRQVEDPDVFGEAWLDADRRGDLGNDLAIAGVVVAGVGLAAGATLVAFGVKKRKQSESAQERAQVMVTPTMGGLVFSGRF